MSNNINSLNQVIEFDESFKSSINLYLNLNNSDKVLRYIPTKSSVSFLNEFLISVKSNKEQASLLIGPYGKGKSHLLLVLLAVISMERNDENAKVVDALIKKIQQVDEIGKETAKNIKDIWNKKGRFLPVLITNTQEDLGQAFLFGLNDALKREGILDLIPDTYYSLAIEKIQSWEENYPETYKQFVQEINENGITISELKAGLAAFSRKKLTVFTDIYPKLTSGGEFNPMVSSDPLTLYKNISEKLVDELGYSGIYIVFDEFSKYIESQSGTSTGANMKLLQDICELANDSKSAQVFITMVAHKGIKEYGKYLSTEIINAFTGIEGRIIEKLFVTSSKNNYELVKNAIIKNESQMQSSKKIAASLSDLKLNAYYSIPAFKSKFEIEDFKNIIFKGCYPLNPISAYLLLNVSEKVAQNERTLFTFISNDEPNSMARYITNHRENMSWNIGADLIYDYFAGLFKKEIINEHVHNEWLNAEYALSKCKTIEEEKVVKALATILIVNKEEEMPAEERILELASGVSDISSIVETLINNKVIYRKGSTNSLVFKTRAGSALKSEIKRLRTLKGSRVNYGKVFEGIMKKFYVIPRKYNADHTMTRFYRHEYMDVDTFMGISNANVLFDVDNYADGKVISLFSTSKIDVESVKEHVLQLSCKKLIVVCPRQGFTLSKKALDYEILQELKANNSFNEDNEVMRKELPILEEDLEKEIREYLYKIYEEDKKCRLFYWLNEELKDEKSANLEPIVSECCGLIYNKTPLVNNELVNRHVISTAQTKKARINIIEAMLNHEDTEEFYSGTNQEATIYRSVFCKTRIKEQKPNEELKEILNLIQEFIDSCSEDKRSLTDLVKKLVAEPYGMRKGLIPLYFGRLLADRNEDIVVYFSNMEVQLSAEIIVNMCEIPEDYKLFISQADLQKEKYIEKLNDLFEVNENRNLSANRIKNILICMQRWFRALPPMTRNASTFDCDKELEKSLIQMRKLLQKVDFNSYEELFVKLPAIFGQSGNLEKTYQMIETSKAVFESYFDKELEKTISATREIFTVRKTEELYHVLKEWYEERSEFSKIGLHGGRITNVMSTIERLNVYDDAEVTRKLIKAVTDVYIENWNDFSFDDYVCDLKAVKCEIEALQKEESDGQAIVSFVGKNGKPVTKSYTHISESTGAVLRNVLEDTLEEFDDLSVNDRVAILLEMIEKVIG